MTDVHPPEISRARRIRSAVRGGPHGVSLRPEVCRHDRRDRRRAAGVDPDARSRSGFRARAEVEGGNWLERKMTIGRLGVNLGSGRFVVEDLQIDGMFPNEPPWLVAKRIDVSLTWRALLHREVLLESIEMSDWKMVVESFPDGRQTFPRLNGPPRPPRTGPPTWSPRSSTCAPIAASWCSTTSDRTGGRSRATSMSRPPRRGEYRGRAQFSNGTIVIQRYEPMTAAMTADLQGRRRQDRDRSDQSRSPTARSRT